MLGRSTFRNRTASKRYYDKLTLDFPKPESVCTTQCSDVDRSLAFSEPNGVCTTLRRNVKTTSRNPKALVRDDAATSVKCLTFRNPTAFVPYYVETSKRQTLDFTKPENVCTTLCRDVARVRSTFGNRTASLRHYVRMSIGVSTFQKKTTSVPHYVASTNEGFTIQNWMASIRHYIAISIGRSNARNRIAHRPTEARYFETRRRPYDTTLRQRRDARLFETT